jgi:hypothetical protein
MLWLLLVLLLVSLRAMLGAPVSSVRCRDCQADPCALPSFSPPTVTVPVPLPSRKLSVRRALRCHMLSGVYDGSTAQLGQRVQAKQRGVNAIARACTSLPSHWPHLQPTGSGATV